MKAFHNDPEVKKIYLTRVKAHAKADEIVKGVYWEKGKGCAIGCTIHSSKHDRYEKELGIPEWLALVEDTLFESLPNKRARRWPIEFLSAIKPGVDLEKAKDPFLILVLESVLKTFDQGKYPKVKKYVDRSLALWKRDDIGSENWQKEAAETAWASDAAFAAAKSGYAAGRAVYAARLGAAADVSATVWAAADEADTAYEEYADSLLNILRSIE